MKDHIFDTLLDPVFIIDQNKVIIYCNEAAANLTGTSIRRLMKSQPQLTEIFDFQPAVPFFIQLESLVESTAYFECQFTTKNNTSGGIQITVQPFIDHQWLIYFRDVTLETRLQNKYRQELDGKEKVIVELQQAKVQLEDYADNLEKKVAQRTIEISQLNQMLQALLDSLHQGFFIIDQHGNSLPVYSRACIDTVETRPMNKKFEEILKLDSNQSGHVQKWLMTVFAEMLPFEDLAPLGPQWYNHSQDKKIHLEYFPLRNEQNNITGIVVVATDLTRLIQAELNAEQQKQKAQFILHFVKNSQSVYQFLHSGQKMSENIIHLCEHWNENHKDELFRLLHTLKGGSALFHLFDISREIHHCEDLLQERQISEILASTKNIHQQLLTTEAELHEQFDRLTVTENGGIYITEKILQQLVKIIPEKHPLLSELERHRDRNSISHYLKSYDLMVHQLCQELGKKSKPIIIEDQKIEYSDQFNSLFNSFIHIFRNYVDHGIENPEERIAKGKNAEGQLKITAQRLEGDLLELRFSDDGGGVSPTKVRIKLSQKNQPHEHLNDHEVIQSILLPEFSTNDKVTSLSGRGVGLDAIAAEVKKLGGIIEVFSEVNKGTDFVIRLPYQQSQSKTNQIAS